jgi:multidrug resistance efflux pump
MSAMSSSSPVRVPQSPAPVVVPPKPKPPRRWLGVLIATALLIGIAFVSYRLLWQPAKPAATQVGSIKTAKAFVGAMDVTLRITGTTGARNYANIKAPILRGPGFGSAMVLLELANSGSMVRKGDLVARIDAQMMIDRLEDFKDQLAAASNDVEKRRAEQKVEWENMQQTLRVAQASFDKSKLDYTAGEVRTDVERELLKLSMDEADARLKQQSRDASFRKTSQDAELRILEISLVNRQRRYNIFSSNIERFTIRAPMDGLLVMSPMFRGGEMGQVQLGDQVQSGQQILKIVDPRSMQVEGWVSQSDSGALRIGQPVQIGLDAFPEVQLKGRVESIGALAVARGWQSNNYVRSVPVKVSIDGTDTRVIPDLSAFAEVVIETVDNQLQVPVGAVQERDGKSFVSVRKGDQFEFREITPGKKNNLNVVVLAGLQAGEEVRLP